LPKALKEGKRETVTSIQAQGEGGNEKGNELESKRNFGRMRRQDGTTPVQGKCSDFFIQSCIQKQQQQHHKQKTGNIPRNLHRGLPKAMFEEIAITS
jgi:hypothetical protein